MTDLPIAPAKDMDLQGLQHKRKQVLALGVGALGAAAALHPVALAHEAPQVFSAHRERGLAGDSGLHHGAHLVHALHRRAQEARAGHQGPLLGRAQSRSTSSPRSAPPASARRAGSVLVALLFAAGSLAVFQVVSRREEAFLAATFPADFADYAARVARFWPRLSLWQEADELRVKPHLVRRTFLDACLFLLAVPAADLAAWLQQLGHLPVLLNLP